MFSRGSLSSISLATVTPSLVIEGEPNFLSIITLRPFGPRVTLTALAKTSTPRFNASRASTLYLTCFAIFVCLNFCWKVEKLESCNVLNRFAKTTFQLYNIKTLQQFTEPRKYLIHA